MEHISFWSVLMMLIYCVETLTANIETLLDASEEEGLEIKVTKNGCPFLVIKMQGKIIII
jgi:hypothetical protein